MPTSSQAEVSQCRQVYWNRQSKRLSHLSIEEFHANFLQRVNNLPQDIPFLMDVVATFFKNIRSDIRRIFEAENIAVLAGPENETNLDGISQLQSETYKRMEGEILTKQRGKLSPEVWSEEGSTGHFFVNCPRNGLRNGANF